MQFCAPAVGLISPWVAPEGGRPASAPHEGDEGEGGGAEEEPGREQRSSRSLTGVRTRQAVHRRVSRHITQVIGPVYDDSDDGDCMRTRISLMEAEILRLANILDVTLGRPPAVQAPNGEAKDK